MEITKTVISKNHEQITITNPPLRLLALMRYLNMKKNKRHKEAIEKYFKENIL